MADEAGFQKNQPKVLKAWAFYDWANSVYSLVITTTIFPIYYSAMTTLSDGARIPVRLFGRDFNADAVYGYSLTLSFLIVVFLSPVLSAVADGIGNKKFFMKLFCYLGSLSCMGLALFSAPENVLLGLFFSVLASVGFWGSLVFYNSFLPDIATHDRQDRLSARGYVFGYIGSVILVIICMFLIQFVAKGAGQTQLFTRLSFVLTGLWWMGFAQYSFRHLPNLSKENVNKNEQFSGRLFSKSFREVLRVGRELFADRNLKFFLSSFFFYSVGMQTVFLMSTLFGKNEVRLDDGKLMLTLLLIQLEAILGALFFSWLSKKIGNKNVITIAVALWIVACVAAYALDTDSPGAELYFYAIAGIIGLVMGGLQSMSRSTYSKLLPADSSETTTFFSFYDVLEKIAIVLGTFVFSTLIEKFSHMRYAALSMSVFFLAGLVLIRFVNADVLRPKPQA